MRLKSAVCLLHANVMNKAANTTSSVRGRHFDKVFARACCRIRRQNLQGVAILYVNLCGEEHTENSQCLLVAVEHLPLLRSSTSQQLPLLRSS